MSASVPSASRTIAVSVREVRMCVDRILLIAGLPGGYLPAVRECVLLSQAQGLGGLAALLECHRYLRMDAFDAIRIDTLADDALAVDGAGLHAWVLVPTLTDVAVDLARRNGRAHVVVTHVTAADELRTLAALAPRYGTRALVSSRAAADRRDVEWSIAIVNASRPRTAEQWDPLLLAALREGFAVEESLWRAIHGLSNKALAPDSVVSRRHAGPVILLDDGSVVGRRPADDDFDVNMLRRVPAADTGDPKCS